MTVCWLYEFRSWVRAPCGSRKHCCARIYEKQSLAECVKKIKENQSRTKVKIKLAVTQHCMSCKDCGEWKM
jgi:hypothetical protein